VFHDKCSVFIPVLDLLIKSTDTQIFNQRLAVVLPLERLNPPADLHLWEGVNITKISKIHAQDLHDDTISYTQS
jgi:hypothetical protein